MTRPNKPALPQVFRAEVDDFARHAERLMRHGRCPPEDADLIRSLAAALAAWPDDDGRERKPSPRSSRRERLRVN